MDRLANYVTKRTWIVCWIREAKRIALNWLLPLQGSFIICYQILFFQNGIFVYRTVLLWCKQSLQQNCNVSTGKSKPDRRAKNWIFKTKLVNQSLKIPLHSTLGEATSRFYQLHHILLHFRWTFHTAPPPLSHAPCVILLSSTFPMISVDRKGSETEEWVWNLEMWKEPKKNR